MSIGICFGSSKYDGDYCGDQFTIMEQSNIIRLYDEKKIHIIESITGLSLDELIRLFAAGYTLTPPKYGSLAEEMKGE